MDIRLRSVETEIAKIGGQLDLLAAKIPNWWQQTANTAGVLALLTGMLTVLKLLHLLH